MTWSFLCIPVEVFSQLCFLYFCFFKWLGSKPWQPASWWLNCTSWWKSTKESLGLVWRSTLILAAIWKERSYTAVVQMSWSFLEHPPSPPKNVSLQLQFLFPRIMASVVLCLSVSSTPPPGSWKDSCWWSQSVCEWRREQDRFCSSSLSSQDNTTKAAVVMWHCRLL